MKSIIFLALTLANVLAFDLRGFRTTEEAATQLISSKRNADTHNFFYQVFISFENGFSERSLCSGSIIGNEWILTAAHCAVNAISATVHLGTLGDPTGEVIHTVANDDILIHYEWDHITGNNDIALIRIPYTSYSEAIKPVKLPSASKSLWNYNGDRAILTEWHHESDNLSSSKSTLKWTFVQVLPKRACRKLHGEVMTYNTICAEIRQRVLACSTDSGGPLVLEVNKVLIGLNTFRDEDGCSNSNSAVFTRVIDYLDWIKLHTGIFY